MVRVARLMAVATLGITTAACVTDSVGALRHAEPGAKPRAAEAPRKRAAVVSTNASKSARVNAATQRRQADSSPAITGAIAPEPRPATAKVAASAAPTIPAQSLFGNWTLAQDGGGKCRFVLGGVPIGSAYAARSDGDCPRGFTNVHSWEIDGDELVLRNPSRGVLGRLAPTGPFRFDGAGVYLTR
jgi:hypothetical protein